MTREAVPRLCGMSDPTSMTAPVTVYSTTSCGYCVAAKRLLSRLQIPYDEVDLTHDWDLRQRLSDENDGYRTVPMIYVEGHFIGGYDQLSALDRQGRLKHLVPAQLPSA